MCSFSKVRDLSRNKQCLMKLKMDMEFQEVRIVEETCYETYPLIIESGSADETNEIG